jgi:hypothetical protein
MRFWLQTWVGKVGNLNVFPLNFIGIYASGVSVWLLLEILRREEAVNFSNENTPEQE